MKHLLYLPIFYISLVFTQVDIDTLWTFTNCGQTGRYGPTLEQCESEYSGTSLEGQITMDGSQGYQEWTVPYSGIYTLEAKGAEGGSGNREYNDGSDYTEGYIEVGAVPSFKILRGDELINLEGDIPAFENNQLYMVSSLTEAVALPETFSLDRAYPNPFNPTTTLSFAIPVDSEVSLSVYNLQGREVVSLVNGNMDAGYHSITWNADSYSSGVYFVKMIAGEFVNTQKLMLVK